MQSAPPVLDYVRTSRPARWRTWVAALVAVPVGVGAGWGTYEAGMGGIVALAFFSIVCPLCIGLLAIKHRIILGFLVCALASATIVFRAMQFDAQIRRPWEAGRYAVQFLIVFGIGAALSLLATVPLTAANRPTA